MRRSLLALCSAVLASACADAPPPARAAHHSFFQDLGPKEVAPPAPAAREDGRLPPLATPLRYALSLRVDPGTDRFSGITTILVDVPQKTWHLVMHGADLRIASAKALVGGEAIEATTTARKAFGGRAPEEIVLTFARPLPPGQATLELSYDAAYPRDLRGLYRVKEADRWYAFTQFEATDARRAFPCFDEPGFKTPFDVMIAAPKGMLAFANAPEIGRQENSATVTYRFATTPPMPTYLVAFAVGDLDVAEGPTSPVPIRLVSAKGKASMGRNAIDATANIVRRLGAYFGSSYPYPKLDIVAVPDFAAGAMENPGLVTFREELLLLDPQRASTGSKRSQAYVIAHELAHQWFGDLVTAKWWNDLWLNEGFAVWAESKIIEEWQPSWGAKMTDRAGSLGVMEADVLLSARRVRQPVVSTEDAMEAFDGITYQKGSAVLGMLESYLGEKTFQQGVRDYLRANAWKNAAADDLLDALSKASGKNVRQMASTFLDRTGVPVVETRLVCEQGNRWHVELSQEPWRLLGSGAPPAQSPWTVPVCVRAEGQSEKKCAELSAGAPAIIGGTGRCPQWILPNPDLSGYYRYTLPPKDFTALANAAPKLEPVARMGVLSNFWADVRAGHIPADAMLEILPAFDRETDRRVVDAVIWILRNMDEALVEDAARPAFRAYVAARLAGHKKRLGWEASKPAAPDEEERALARQAVLRALADLAEDDATLREAEDRAARWLKDPASVDPEIGQLALELASRRAGADRLEALRQVAKNAKAPQDRVAAIRAMASFEEKSVLDRALDWMLTDEVKIQDVRYVIPTAMRRQTRANAIAWVKAHWDALRAKLPGAFAGRLMHIAGNACTQKDKDDLEAFLRPHAAEIPGGNRPLAEGLEASSLCVALRAHGAASVTKHFVKK
jgi:aminopeptidase N